MEAVEHLHEIQARDDVATWSCCAGCGWWFPSDSRCDNEHSKRERQIIASAALGIEDGTEYTAEQYRQVLAIESGMVAEPDVDDSRYESMVRLEKLGAKILGTDKPLYCLYASELPAEHVAFGVALGTTGRGLDAALREYIPWWRGRGRAIVVNARLIAEHIPGDIVAAIGQVFLHELSHCAASGFQTEEATPEEESFARMQMGFSWPLREPLPTDEVSDHFVSHGPDFVRALVHVAARAAVCDVNLLDVIAAEFARFALSPWPEYVDALQGEVEQWDDHPLDEVLATAGDPPAEFLDLYHADVMRFRLGY
jgi:hypothetical protein